MPPSSWRRAFCFPKKTFRPIKPQTPKIRQGFLEIHQGFWKLHQGFLKVHQGLWKLHQGFWNKKDGLTRVKPPFLCISGQDEEV
jgi:hypothetical protein